MHACVSIYIYIYEKNVRDLATAIVSAERLLDFGNEASFQRKTTRAPNTGGKTYKPPGHWNEGPNRMNESNDTPSEWTDRPPQNNCLEDLTLKRTIRRHLYDACCVKAPTNCPTVLIGLLSVHSNCPFNRVMTQESRLHQTGGKMFCP